MNTVRLNITLPKEIGIKVKASSNASALITQSLREKFERDEAKRLAITLNRAYTAAAQEDEAVAHDWNATSGDGL